MATSMDDCFLSSHDIDMPIQHRRHAGPSLAMHVSLDLIVHSPRSASFFGQGSPSPVIDDADCEPMQMECPFQHRPALCLGRLYPLQQWWPDRKARYTAVTAMSNETPRRAP